MSRGRQPSCQAASVRYWARHPLALWSSNGNIERMGPGDQARRACALPCRARSPNAMVRQGACCVCRGLRLVANRFDSRFHPRGWLARRCGPGPLGHPCRGQDDTARGHGRTQGGRRPRCRQAGEPRRGADHRLYLGRFGGAGGMAGVSVLRGLILKSRPVDRVLNASVGGLKNFGHQIVQPGVVAVSQSYHVAGCEVDC